MPFKSDFGESWWAQRWRKVLESFGWADRLARGRSYARSGAVRKIEILPGAVQARVQGSQATPYKVQIAVRPLSKAEWERVIAALGAKAIFAAQLLAGDMPPEVEEVFTAAKAPLFPTPEELETDCSCPDWGNPCKHVAATYYVLGSEFDRDPFLLFRLRGRDREQILDALRAVRMAAAAEEEATAPVAPPEPAPAPAPPVPALDAPGVDFWRLAAPLDDFRVEIARPPLQVALLKRLGPPAFWQPPVQFLTLMSEVYSQVTEEALRAAFGEEGV